MRTFRCVQEAHLNNQAYVANIGDTHEHRSKLN